MGIKGSDGEGAIVGVWILSALGWTVPSDCQLGRGLCVLGHIEGGLL
jgi:hypothetical protein